MTIKRELEGIGYHYTDSDDDCLLVDRWTNRPDDLKGQSITIGKLLSREFRNSDSRDNRSAVADRLTPKKFKFRIIVEIKRAENGS